MHRHRFGDATVVRFTDGRLETEPMSFVPEWAVGRLAPSPERTWVDFAAYGILVDGLRVIVDPWLVTDGARSAPGASARADRIAAELTEAGFPPDKIDLVVLSHLDGIGWSVRPTEGATTPMFPNARYLLSATSMAAVDAGVIDAPEGLQVLVDAGLLETLALDARVSPSLQLQPAEGHTPGHAVVRLRSGDDDVAFTGHLFIGADQVADPDIPNDTDPTQAAAERRALLAELAATGGVLFGQLLGGEGGGRVVTDVDSYRLTQLQD